MARRLLPDLAVMKMKSRRSKLLIDRPVQLKITGRMILHWFCFLLVVVVTLPLARTILLFDVNTPLATRFAEASVDALIIGGLFLVMLPYFVYDVFRTTNRFAGPMYRVHQTLKAIVEGIPVPPIKFREGDFWQEVAVDFNKAVNTLRKQSHHETSAREFDSEKESEVETAETVA